MATEVVVPFVGESMERMHVRLWLNAVGDTVTSDAPLVEITTAKIDFMISAPASGRLAEIRAPDGTEVKPGDVVGVIE